MRARPDGKREVQNVKLAYDFSYWETIRKDVGEAELRLNAPHMTRYLDGRLFDSHFKDVSYRVPGFSDTEISRHTLVDEGFRKAFERALSWSCHPKKFFRGLRFGKRHEPARIVEHRRTDICRTKLCWQSRKYPAFAPVAVIVTGYFAVQPT